MYGSGYYVGCTVFYDADGDLAANAGEPSGLVDEAGLYSLATPLRNSTGKVVLAPSGLCVDQFTLRPIQYRLRAPTDPALGSPVTVSALSNLASAMQDRNISREEAVVAIISAYSIANSGLNLYSTDALFETLSGTAGAKALYLAGSRVDASTAVGVAFLKGLVQSASSPLPRRLLQTVITVDEGSLVTEALASQLQAMSSAGQTVDSATVSVTVKAMLLSAKAKLQQQQNVTYSTGTDQAMAAAESAAALDVALRTAAEAGTPLESIRGLAKSLVAAHTTVAAAVTNLAAGSLSLADFRAAYTGTALAGVVNETLVAGEAALTALATKAAGVQLLPPPPPPPSKKGRSLVLILGIVGGILVLCCAGACGGRLFWKKRRSNIGILNTYDKVQNSIKKSEEEDEEQVKEQGPLIPADIANTADTAKPVSASSPKVKKALAPQGVFGAPGSLEPLRSPGFQPGRLDARTLGKKEREEAERAEFENILREQQEYIARRLGAA